MVPPGSMSRIHSSLWCEVTNLNTSDWVLRKMVLLVTVSASHWCFMSNSTGVAKHLDFLILFCVVWSSWGQGVIDRNQHHNHMAQAISDSSHPGWHFTLDRLSWPLSLQDNPKVLHPHYWNPFVPKDPACLTLNVFLRLHHDDILR